VLLLAIQILIAISSFKNTASNLAYSGGVLGTASPAKFGFQTGLQVSLMQLREAFAMLRFEEARARYGSRTLNISVTWAFDPLTLASKRPEYLGGGRQTIQFSEVLQTAEGTDPVGDLKGHGIGAMRSNRFRRYIEEHGVIMTLMCVKPENPSTCKARRGCSAKRLVTSSGKRNSNTSVNRRFKLVRFMLRPSLPVTPLGIRIAMKNTGVSLHVCRRVPHD